jgi:hypothetical protein
MLYLLAGMICMLLACFSLEWGWQTSGERPRFARELLGVLCLIGMVALGYLYDAHAYLPGADGCRCLPGRHVLRNCYLRSDSYGKPVICKCKRALDWSLPAAHFSSNPELVGSAPLSADPTGFFYSMAGNCCPGQVDRVFFMASCSAWVTHKVYFAFTAICRAT